MAPGALCLCYRGIPMREESKEARLARMGREDMSKREEGENWSGGLSKYDLVKSWQYDFSPWLGVLTWVWSWQQWQLLCKDQLSGFQGPNQASPEGLLTCRDTSPPQKVILESNAQSPLPSWEEWKWSRAPGILQHPYQAKRMVITTPKVFLFRDTMDWILSPSNSNVEAVTPMCLYLEIGPSGRGRGKWDRRVRPNLRELVS